jgi:hypothetical protein
LFTDSKTEGITIKEEYLKVDFLYENNSIGKLTSIRFSSQGYYGDGYYVVDFEEKKFYIDVVDTVKYTFFY